MHVRRFACALTLSALGAGIATVAIAAEPTVINASPEVSYYACGAYDVNASWSVSLSGGNGSYTWSVSYGDGGTTSGGPGWTTTHFTQSHTFHPHYACKDYNQSFNASSAGGGSSYDGTRVVYSR